MPRTRAGFTAWTVDLADLDAAEQLIRDASAEFGRVDVLVNNAAIPARIPVPRLTPDDVARVMDVNFHAPVRMTLALLPGWLARGTGCVVNVSSLGGRIPIAQEAAYCASKYALCGWSEVLAVDLHGTGVEVKLVLPGPIDTEIWDQPGNDPAHYDGPLIPAAESAASVVDAIEGTGFEYYAPPEFPGGVGLQHDVVLNKSADPGAFVDLMGALRPRGDRSMSDTGSTGRLYFRQLLSGRDFARDDPIARQMVNFVYLIGDRETGDAVAVDPAYGVTELVDTLAADGLRLSGVLATHYHADHCGGDIMGYSIEGLRELLALDEGAVPVHVQRDESEWVKRSAGLSDSDLTLHDSGDVVLVGDIPITLMHTPGHTPGSQCFVVDGRLVAGDTLFLEGCGRTDLPGLRSRRDVREPDPASRDGARLHHPVSGPSLLAGALRDHGRRRANGTTCSGSAASTSGVRSWAGRSRPGFEQDLQASTGGTRRLHRDTVGEPSRSEVPPAPRGTMACWTRRHNE